MLWKYFITNEEISLQKYHDFPELMKIAHDYGIKFKETVESGGNKVIGSNGYFFRVGLLLANFHMPHVHL